MQSEIIEIVKNAKLFSSQIALASDEVKNKILFNAANELRKNKDQIKAANKKDMDKAIADGLSSAMLDRLELNDDRIEAMAVGIENIAKLKDPVGRVLSNSTRPNGLEISQVSVPLGVIGIIYESRPNVTADAGALCIKSGNAAILRGGKESFYSSEEIIQSLHKAIEQENINKSIISYIPTIDREAVGIMLTLSDYIDVIIPRGGKGLCKRIQDESKIPTLQHLDGICHSYIHKSADFKMANEVVLNAKMRRVGICGATESLVIDKEFAEINLTKLIDNLIAKDCEIRGDEIAKKIDDRVILANDSDWDTEYLAAILSIKIVNDYKEAIDFVNSHSSHHTDAIIASDLQVAKQYLNEVDSAIVMHNTSTQFADGGEFGMGAEIGISTGRLHARGPVGVDQLTTYKYIVNGTGQVRP